MARETVAFVTFAIDRDGSQFLVAPEVWHMPTTKRAVSLLTEDESAQAARYVTAAAELLADYAFRILHPDLVDNLILGDPKHIAREG